jgi:hypothetical protein
MKWFVLRDGHGTYCFAFVSFISSRAASLALMLAPFVFVRPDSMHTSPQVLRWVELSILVLLVTASSSSRTTTTTTTSPFFAHARAWNHQPVRNLHVVFRGQTYTIPDGVSTVGELTERFERIAGLSTTTTNEDDGDDDDDVGSSKSSKSVDAPRIVWNGRVLTDRNEALAKAGIKNGDRVLIVPGDSKTGGLDVLAMWLFMLSSHEDAILGFVNLTRKRWEEQRRQQQQNSDSHDEAAREAWTAFTEDLVHLKRTDVADSLRNGFDLAYHQLRAWWEHPSFRQRLHDPDRIENYRKVVSTNLSERVLGVSPPSLQRAVRSPEVWRKEFQRITSNVIRVGDTIMDGVLDLLLDVLKRGNSAAAGSSSSKYAAQSLGGLGGDAGGAEAAAAAAAASDPRMDDPSLANDLLYELSESDDDT